MAYIDNTTNSKHGHLLYNTANDSSRHVDKVKLLNNTANDSSGRVDKVKFIKQHS